MFFGIKPFTARRARFHQKNMFGSLGRTVASIMVLDSKSIADAMVCACRKLLRDLSGVKPPILYSLYGPIDWHQPE